MNKGIFKASIVVFLDMFVAIGVSFGTLPFRLRDFGGSASAMGIAMMLFSLLQFVTIPIWGALSDRVGRTRMMILMQVGAAAGMVVIAFAPGVGAIYLGRAIGGAFGGTMMLTSAYVSDVTPDEKRTHAVSVLGIALVVGGFMVGPALGGALLKVGPRVPFLVAAGVALANAAFIRGFVPEPTRRKSLREVALSRATVALAMSDSRTRGAVLLNVLAFGGITAFQTCFAFYMGSKFGFEADALGPLLAILGVTGIIAQSGVVGWLGRRFGEPRVAMVSAAVTCLAVLVIGRAPALGFVIAGLVVFGFAQSTLLPSLMSLATLGAPAGMQGTVMGLFFAMQSLVFVVGPPLYGRIYDDVGKTVPFILAAALFGIVSLLATLWKWRASATATPAA